MRGSAPTAWARQKDWRRSCRGWCSYSFFSLTVSGGRMLRLSDLTVRVGDWVGRYDLSAPRGALVVLVGPSGGGKSTLLNAVAGFERLERGTMTFDGESLVGRKPADRPVAIVFQDHNLLPNLTVAENAGLALSPSLKLGSAE